MNKQIYVRSRTWQICGQTTGNICMLREALRALQTVQAAFPFQSNKKLLG